MTRIIPGLGRTAVFCVLGLVLVWTAGGRDATEPVEDDDTTVVTVDDDNETEDTGATEGADETEGSDS